MKLKIELSPYNAFSILAFCREYFNDSNKDRPEFKAIHEALSEFENELNDKATQDEMNDALAENQVNQLIGKSPIRR